MVWILCTFSNADILNQLLDILLTFVLFSVNVFIFAVIYLVNGLIYKGNVVTPTPEQALYFSVGAVTGSGFSPFEPHDDIYLFVSLESLIGFLMIPVLLSLFFLLIESRAVRDRNGAGAAE